MYCPVCKAEYKAGIKICPECQVKLVEEQPPPNDFQYEEFIPVFKTADPSTINFVKSILESSGIRYALMSQGLQAILALGEVKFEVPEEDAAAARELLFPIAANKKGDLIEK